VVRKKEQKCANVAGLQLILPGTSVAIGFKVDLNLFILEY